MALRLISAEERLAQRQKINIAMFGPSGIGKTHAARDLDPATTLFIDGEAGTLSLGKWGGTVLSIREEAAKIGCHPWELCRAIACLLSGPEPSEPDGPYGKKAFDYYAANVADPAMFEPFQTLFVDSITVASRWSFSWSQMQPEALSEKTGKPDTRGAYGLHGREMVRWLTQLQHQSKSIVVVGILDEKKDDFGRTYYEPQIVGGTAARELPGIFDVVTTLAKLTTEDGQTYRAFVTEQGNSFGFPAKARGGLLDPIEEPSLSKLMDKIRSNLPA